MADRRFAPEERLALLVNPNVEKVSDKMVFFTSEFKMEFIRRHADGELPYDILVSAGIDPDVLGSKRISGMGSNFRKQAPCDDLPPAARPQAAPKCVVTSEVGRLRNEVQYLRQEVEFLKKISLAGEES